MAGGGSQGRRHLSLDNIAALAAPHSLALNTIVEGAQSSLRATTGAGGVNVTANEKCLEDRGSASWGGEQRREGGLVDIVLSASRRRIAAMAMRMDASSHAFETLFRCPAWPRSSLSCRAHQDDAYLRDSAGWHDLSSAIGRNKAAGVDTSSGSMLIGRHGCSQRGGRASLPSRPLVEGLNAH